jgi:putative ubiquitin-RnfH superfamily antitoxin RatB of RatAB toxin-antitoxin module
MAEPGIRVTLAWIEGSDAITRDIEVDAASLPVTYAQLLEMPAVKAALPEWIAAPFGLAVFGRHRQPGEIVAEGDRIELLPPLRVDPKLARLRRAAKRR